MTKALKFVGFLLVAGLIVRTLVVLAVCAIAGDIRKVLKRETQDVIILAITFALPISALVVSALSLRMLSGFGETAHVVFFACLILLAIFSHTDRVGSQRLRLYSAPPSLAGLVAEVLVYLSFLMWDRPELKSGIWFLSGGVAALVFFELTVSLFYFLPKAAYQLVKGAVSAGLLLLFFRAVAYRFIALLLLWFVYTTWGPLYHRAFSLGISIILVVYGSYAFTKRSRTGLSESFIHNSARYPTKRPT